MVARRSRRSSSVPACTARTARRRSSAGTRASACCCSTRDASSCRSTCRTSRRSGSTCRRRLRRRAIRAWRASSCGASLARQRRVSRARLLHRRQVALLGRLVPAADRRRPGAAGRLPSSQYLQRSTTPTSRARPASSRRRTSSSATCSRCCSARSARPQAAVPNIETTIGTAASSGAAGRAGQRAGVGPVQLRQVQQPAAPGRRDPRRRRCSGMNDANRRLFLVPRGARHQAAHRRRRGAHRRGRRRRPAQVPARRPAVRGGSRRERDREHAARAAFVSDPADGPQSDGARAQRLHGPRAPVGAAAGPRRTCRPPRSWCAA